MHEVQGLEACPQAFAGGMGLSDRLKTLKNLWEAAERCDESMGSRYSFGDRAPQTLKGLTGRNSKK